MSFFDVPEIGSRVRVWWAGNDQWFAGKIVSITETRGHRIQYDDGETKYHDLSDAAEVWQLEHAPSKEKYESCSKDIKLKVVTQDGIVSYFKCEQTTPLQKLMHAFCNQQRVTMGSVRFLFGGNRINQTQTPNQLEMVDDDTIYVMLEQQGGGGPIRGPEIGRAPTLAPSRLMPLSQKLKTYHGATPGKACTFKDVSRDIVNKAWPAKFVTDQEVTPGFSKKCVCRNKKCAAI